MDISLVLAGHTHAAALGVPIGEPGGAPTPITIAFADASIMAITGGWPRDDAYWRAVEQAAQDRIPVLVWEGNQHQDAFLIEVFPPIDFVLSAAPTLPMDPRASYVAEAQLRALFAPSIAPLAAAIRALAENDRPVLVAGTPPPIADLAAARAQIAIDPGFAAKAERRGLDLATAPIASAYTMQKLWSLLQSMTAETTALAGGVFVPVPDRVRGADGFLLEQYRGDATHANAAFGTEMLAELVAAARSLQTARTDAA